jgi:hypothetical protein
MRGGRGPVSEREKNNIKEPLLLHTYFDYEKVYIERISF